MGSGAARLGEIPPWVRRDLDEGEWKFSIWTHTCRAGPVNQAELKATFVRRMIGNMVTCLMAYKARMEYQALDIDGDRPTQYKELIKKRARQNLWDRRCFNKALSRAEARDEIPIWNRARIHPG